MAVTYVKVTYSVQAQTVQRVQELSTKWGVPKSEVIRRVVDGAAKGSALARLTPLEALRKLQNTAGMSMATAKAFEREVRLSRRSSGRKRG